MTYETTDIYISSTLIAYGYQVGVKRVANTNKAIFTVEVQNTEGLLEVQEIANQYWQKTLSVDPCTLFGAYKQLKEMIFN